MVALAGTGFAHRVIAQDVDESLLSYLAAGGILAELCGESEKGTHGLGQSCDACRLVDSVLLPKSTQGLAGSLGGQLATCHISPTQTHVSVVQNAEHPVRAPPVV